MPRPFYQERYSDGFVIEDIFSVSAMSAEHFSVIGSKNEYRVFFDSQFLYCGAQSSYVVIQIGYHSVINAHPIGYFVALER